MNKKKFKQKINHKSPITLWVVMIIFFISELYIYTWSSVQCTEIKYTISELSKSINTQKAMQQTLTIELERLKSPNRIAHIAKKYIGLEMPNPEQIIVIK
jgi:cell division protein FtsL